MRGKIDETEYLLLFGPDVTVVADQSERETENLLPDLCAARSMVGEFAIQTLSKGKRAASLRIGRLYWRSSLWRGRRSSEECLPSIN